MAEKLLLPDLDHTNEMYLHELSGVIERLTDRHNDNPRVFTPAEIDDEIGQAIQDGTYSPWNEDIPQQVLDALVTNLLTEDGLPYYTSALLSKTPRNHPFVQWIYQWTAEEGRHSPSIFAFMHRSGNLDMAWLEKMRMYTISHPDTPQPGSYVEGIVYPAIQEPATEISHRRTISLLPDTHRLIGRKAVSPVIGDEVKHGIFYGELSEAALEVNPSFTIIAIAKQITGFAMPGKGIPGFKERAKAIENADIFGAKQLKGIYDELLATRWPIGNLSNLTREAEYARELIFKKVGQLGKLIARRADISASNAEY